MSCQRLTASCIPLFACTLAIDRRTLCNEDGASTRSLRRGHGATASVGEAALPKTQRARKSWLSQSAEPRQSATHRLVAVARPSGYYWKLYCMTVFSAWRSLTSFDVFHNMVVVLNRMCLVVAISWRFCWRGGRHHPFSS